MLERTLKTEPIMAAMGLVMLLSLVATLPALVIDDRLFQGDNVWIKTIKFQISLLVYFLSLAFFAQWAKPEILKNRWFILFAQIVCFTTVAEIVWIGGASAFGVASHYNDGPIMGAIYGLMGIFAITLTSMSIVLGWAVWKHKNSGLDPALKWSIVTGLVLTGVLTIFSAGPLASLPGHHVGDPVTGAQVPLMGWSLEVGDPRVAHFLATHTMHFVPVVGLLSVMFLSARYRMAIVNMAAVGYTLLVGFVMMRAMNGYPIVPVA